MTDAERKRMAEQWMTAFVAMWTERSVAAKRHRDAIEDAIKRLENGSPAWEVASRLMSHLSGVPENENGRAT